MIQTFKSRQPDLIGFQWLGEDSLATNLVELLGTDKFTITKNSEYAELKSELKSVLLEYNDQSYYIYETDFIVKHPTGSIDIYEDYEFEKLYQVS